ncbi:hypothetical protein PSACC_03111 [Paramicrosporidium saccamoebae]|uniref:Pentatricopeptide repeat-containing protein n=1 Tax=Paramicrosporidium saccamoebae TaxID=1246581 RepID=A0A2H9TH67_9FUNG|nr:hypothetical protein PSACC_03111 [Paramicrosporidium saccamoebae]
MFISRRCLVTSAPPKKTARYFDPHTVSIWAENMSRRGASPAEAVRLILNRMDMGRARHRPELYNTALDICGHNGMLMDSARILHKMVGSNVRPNERTITSVLNAIAEYVQKSRLEDSSSTGNIDVQKNSEGFPGLEAFQLKSKRDAAQLAIKLYASWIEHSPNVVRKHPFNALLKVLWRSGAADLLPSVFPTDGSNTEWVPDKPDIITYTTAILACQNDPNATNSAVAYWIAFQKSDIKADTGIIMAILVAMQSELRFMRAPIPKAELTVRRGLLASLCALLQPLDVPVNTSNVFLDVAHRLRCLNLGFQFWEQKILPILASNQSAIKSKQHFNEGTLVHVFQIMIRLDNASQIFPLFDKLQSVYGMHLSTRLLNVMLLAARRAGDRRRPQRLFNRFVQNAASVMPDQRTLYQLLLNISEDTGLPKMMGKEQAKKIHDWFATRCPAVLKEAKNDTKIQWLLTKLGLE